MRIGIISALDLEIQELKMSLKIESSIIIAGFKFYLCNLNDLEIILAICDVGKVNAASCTQIMISKFNITHIINLGVAGSLKDDVCYFDVVISNSLTHHDVRKTQMIERFPFQPSFIPSKFLQNIAMESAKSLNIKYHLGKIVTGESFISDLEIKNKIIQDYNPYCVEMEGAAIAHVAFINNIDFLVIRSISDNASENTILDDITIEKASKNIGNIVFETLIELSKINKN